MKRIIMYCFFVFTAMNHLFAQNFSLDDGYPFQEEPLLSMMTIKDDSLFLKYDETLKKSDIRIKFKISHLNGMPFIELSENMPPEVAAWWEYQKNPDIETNNKIMFLAFQGKDKIMFAFTKGFYQERAPLTATRFDEWGNLFEDCSSYLVEKNKSYPVENLRKLVVDTPWVEGVPGDGIGEGFTIQGRQFKKALGPYLLLINGYISYEKPYLYKQNNRIKKIKVTGLKSGNSKILDVLDTPHPQTVDISFITQPENIRVEIADVYKGTKYDDTCLHYCFAYDEPVIPYENSIDE